MLRQSWQWDFVFWAVPVAVIAAIIFGLAPRAPAAAPTAASRRWMPDFRNPMIWRIGLLLGSVNATYFSMNGFLPDYLTHTGRPDLINAALTALNLGQLPASFLLLASADRMVRTVWSYLVCGLIVPRLACWRSCSSAASGSSSAARCGAASAPRCWCWSWRCRR